MLARRNWLDNIKRKMLRYVNSGIVFQEIPDEVTLSVNISNCPCRCPGCHSSYLWEDIGEELDMRVIDTFMEKYGGSITCICFMGGDASPADVESLAIYIHSMYDDVKVGWYSGRPNVASGVNKGNFDYIKVGAYIQHLGGLKDRSTNQRLYKKQPDGTFVDITSRFWRK